MQAWVDRGGLATLVSDAVPKWWGHRYRAEGVDVLDLAELDSGPPWATADWVVLDGYRFGPDDQALIAASGARLLVIDDHGQAGRYLADVVLDQNLDASASAYSDRDGRVELLLGTRFALLRREFAVAHSLARETLPAASRVLLSMGGFPAPVTAVLVSGVVDHLEATGMMVDRLDGVEMVGLRMANADLALSAAGSTCWELCCTGLPSVLVSSAPNQRPLAQAMASHGAAIDAGPLGVVSSAHLASVMLGLAADAGRRQAMTDAGRALVDGRGARRVVTRMLGHLLDLRPAAARDCQLYWEWANDPAVRASSFSSQPIQWDDHKAWFAGRLADPASYLYLALDGEGRPIGQVRFEVDGDTADTNVSVAPNQRGRSWGGALIDAAARRLFQESAVTSIEARIKPHNSASRSAFDDAAFVPVREASSGPKAWLRYARRSDAACS